MPREITTQGEAIQDLQNLAAAMAANSSEFPHLDAPRSQLATILVQAQELITLQAELAAKRLEASKKLRELIGEGRRLGNFLRVGLKQLYGPRSEKLATFRMRPFRGFKAAKPEEPATPVASEQQAP